MSTSCCNRFLSAGYCWCGQCPPRMTMWWRGIEAKRIRTSVRRRGSLASRSKKALYSEEGSIWCTYSNLAMASCLLWVKREVFQIPWIWLETDGNYDKNSLWKAPPPGIPNFSHSPRPIHYSAAHRIGKGRQKQRAICCECLTKRRVLKPPKHTLLTSCTPATSTSTRPPWPLPTLV